MTLKICELAICALPTVQPQDYLIIRGYAIYLTAIYGATNADINWCGSTFARSKGKIVFVADIYGLYNDRPLNLVV